MKNIMKFSVIVLVLCCVLIAQRQVNAGIPEEINPCNWRCSGNDSCSDEQSDFCRSYIDYVQQPAVYTCEGNCVKSDVVGDVDVCVYTSDSPDDGCGYDGGLACQGDRKIRSCTVAASGSCTYPTGCTGDWVDDTSTMDGINNCSVI